MVRAREMVRRLGRRRDPAEALARPYFDPEFYRRAYPDLHGSDAALLRDYLGPGWRAGRDPSADFSTSDYLRAHDDVRRADVNPLVHYATDGAAEGRRLWPSRALLRPGERMGTDPYFGLVDETFYRSRHPDLVATGRTAAEHFQDWGWQEGRDPNPWFDTSFYLWANPDVAAQGIDPFAHFLRKGRLEGRRPSDPAGINRAAFLAARSSAGGVVEGSDQPTVDGGPAPFTSLDLPPGAKVVLAVTNRDHRRHRGGVEACTTAEEQHVLASGRHYVRLSPVVERPQLSDSPETLLRVVCDGEDVGSMPSSGLVNGVVGWLGQAEVERVAVHGLLGHHPESLVEAVAGLPTDYWVHDFYALCVNPALSRSGLEFCGAPPATSSACRCCLFGAGRARHVARLADFLDRSGAEVVAPSAFAADTWAALTGRDRSAVTVVPHGRLRLDGEEVVPAPGAPRLAFVGAPLHTKGWDQFVDVARWAVSRGDLVPVHVGEHEVSYPGVTELPSTGGRPLARTLAESSVDAVLLWSTVPETFGLVAHEAMAAGCLVVTNPATGHLAVAAQEAGRAVLLPDSRCLRRAAATGTLAREIAERRAGCRRGTFELDGLTPARLGVA